MRRKKLLCWKRRKKAVSYGEKIMESVRSPEEKVNLNTPIPAPHIIPFYSSYPIFFPQVSNPSSKEAKENVSGEWEGTEEAKKLLCQKRRETPQPYL